MTSFLKTTALALTAVFAVAGTSQAALIVADLNAPGDGLITQDDATGLEWLDVNATLNVSASGVLSTSFVTDQGFRLATGAELTALWAGAGVTLAFPAIAGNLAGVQELISKMGCTGNCSDAANLAQSGFILGSIPNRARIAISSGTAAYAFLTFGGSSPSSTRGNYLVRNASIAAPLPVPGAALLLGFGLIGITAARRKAA